MSRTATTQWRRVAREVRSQGRANNLPCTICRGALGAIDYRTQSEADAEARRDGAYWLIGKQRPLALDVDHIIPHANGGKDVIENAAQTHAVCNRRAGAKGTQPQPRKPQRTMLNGFWHPHDGNSQPLPGRATPGARTATHEFRAG